MLNPFPSDIHPFAVTISLLASVGAAQKILLVDLEMSSRLKPKLSGSLSEVFCDLDHLILAPLFSSVLRSDFLRTTACCARQGSAGVLGFPWWLPWSSHLSVVRSAKLIHPDGLLWCHRPWETLPGPCLWQLPWCFVLTLLFLEPTIAGHLARA